MLRSAVAPQIEDHNQKKTKPKNKNNEKEKEKTRLSTGTGHDGGAFYAPSPAACVTWRLVEARPGCAQRALIFDAAESALVHQQNDTDADETGHRPHVK